MILPSQKSWGSYPFSIMADVSRVTTMCHYYFESSVWAGTSIVFIWLFFLKGKNLGGKPAHILISVFQERSHGADDGLGFLRDFAQHFQRDGARVGVFVLEHLQK